MPGGRALAGRQLQSGLQLLPAGGGRAVFTAEAGGVGAARPAAVLCCAVLLGLPLFTAVLLLQLISCLFTLSASGVAAVLSVSQYAVAETGYFRGTFSFVWLYASK